MSLMLAPWDGVPIEERGILPIDVCEGITLEPLYAFIKDEGKIPNPEQFPSETEHLKVCARCREKMRAFFEKNSLWHLFAEWQLAQRACR